MAKELLEPTEREVETITEEQYNEMLDEQGDIQIGSLTYRPSDVLKNVDPIAYRCGFSDVQEYETKYDCPVCGEEHDDYDEAKFCCQTEEEEEDEDI